MAEKGLKHIAFDLGAESGRAVVGWLEDGKLKMEELHRFPTQGLLVRGTLRWNVYRFYEAILEALRKYAAQYGGHLDSIGVDTWGLDYGLLDDTGDLLELPYHYRDARTAGTDRLVDSRLGNRRVYEITGIQFLICNTLNQLTAAVRDDNRAVREAKGLLFMADLLHYMLGGGLYTEYTVASISQMMDTRSRCWSDEIFDAIGIPRAFQTTIVRAGDCVGTLRDDIAAQTGINGGVMLIAPAVHDTASAAAAVPAQGKDWAYISTGTWCIAGLETEKPIISDESFRLNISNSGGAFDRNLFLKNVMGLWIIQQCKKEWNRQHPELGYAEIMSLAEQAPPFAAFIDPDDELFFNPQNGVEAVRDYLKKTGHSTAAANTIGGVARLVFEGLALKYRYVLKRLCAVAGRRIERLHLIGGGIQNTLLCQMTANALGVKTFAGPIEATAAGNLLLQAYGSGEIASLEELRGIVANTFTLHEYLPQQQQQWSEAYGQFLNTCGLKE